MFGTVVKSNQQGISAEQFQRIRTHVENLNQYLVKDLLRDDYPKDSAHGVWFAKIRWEIKMLNEFLKKHSELIDSGSNKWLIGDELVYIR